MPPRPWRNLTIFLLLATLGLTTRQASCLATAAPRKESASPGKGLHARGRNRIGSPARSAFCCTPVRIVGGGARPPRPSRPLARREIPPALKIHRPISSRPARPSGLHLRC